MARSWSRVAPLVLAWAPLLGWAGCGGGSGSTPDEAGPFSTAEATLSFSCVGLVPPGPGPRFRDVAVIPSSATCLGGSSDELGNVAVGWRDAGGTSHWRVHSPTGALVGTFDAPGVSSLMPQDSGFQGFGVLSAPARLTLATWTHTGAPVRTATLASGDSSGWLHAVSVDDGGGSLVVLGAWNAGHTSYRVTAQRFSSQSQPRSAPRLVASGKAPPGWLLGAVDDSSRSIVVLDGAFVGLGPDHLAVQWLDRLGGSLTPLFDGGAVPGVTAAHQRALSGMVAAEFALQVDGRWTRRFPRLATFTTAAPAWLQAHPRTDLHLIKDYGGYAIFPWAGEQLAQCGQRVEIHASAGNTCGSVTFTQSSGACLTSELDDGACEGSVIQRAVRESCSGGTCTCTHDYFPHILPDG